MTGAGRRGGLRVEVPEATGVVARTGGEVAAGGREGGAEDRGGVTYEESECSVPEEKEKGKEKRDEPSRLLLHLVISLTLNTASGSHSIVKTSSVLSLPACFGLVNKSA